MIVREIVYQRTGLVIVTNNLYERNKKYTGTILKKVQKVRRSENQYLRQKFIKNRRE